MQKKKSLELQNISFGSVGLLLRLPTWIYFFSSVYDKFLMRENDKKNLHVSKLV